MNKAILLVFLFGLILTDGETSGTCVIEWTSSTVALSTKSKEFIEQGNALNQDTDLGDGFYLQNIKLGSNCNGAISFGMDVTLAYEDANTDDSWTETAGCYIMKIPQGNDQSVDSMICLFSLDDDEKYNSIEIPVSPTVNSGISIQVKGNQKLTISLTNTNENENSIIRYNLVLLMILLVLF